WWYADDSAEKEDVGEDENTVFDEDPKPDILSREINLFEYFWDNVGCDDSMKKVESVEAKTVNIVNIDRDEEGKTDMSVENLPESLDEEENRNDGVQALEYCQKSTDEENVSIRGHSDDKEDKIIRDENKALICHQNADITNKDVNEILEEDSKHVEGRESFGEPKLEDDYKLVFDRGKMIESGNPIFKVPFEIIDIETMLKGSNSENAVVGLNEDVGEIAPDGRAKIVRIELGNVREKHDEKRKYIYHREYEFRDE
ncbi:13281_t:CDS:2, partial [Racocetra fulgida]